MKSKITGGETSLLFTKKVLNKYDVKYYKCNDTGFIQTEDPFWLAEAYSSAITKLDIGLASRNIILSEKIGKLLIANFNYKGVFLDYAGGYGLFTRLMRDKGFNFYNTDNFCQNLFAEHFDLNGLPPGTAFELVTAFEVLEHLSDPIGEIKNILKFSDNLIFSTELQPANQEDLSDWWYLSPETGQHIAFYNTASLEYIANLLGYNFYTDGKSLHLFTKKNFKGDVLEPVRDSFLLRKAKKLVRKADEKTYNQLESLLMSDYQYIKEKLK
jgi:methyltransferase family protein